MVLRIYSSNRQETLAEIVKQQLYAGSISAFDRRLIVTFSAIQQQWLQQNFAADSSVGIAMGMEFMREDECMSVLAAFFSYHSDSAVAKHHPSQLELSLAIENQLTLQTSHTGSSLTRKQRRRNFQFAEAYANLFERYGRYGGTLLKKWPETPQALFQQQLWQLFDNDTSAWTFPYRWLEDLNFSTCSAPAGLQVHLFAPNSLCQIHQSLLEKLAEHIPVHFYLLTPCQMFWTDQLTGHERRRINAYWRRKGASLPEQQRLGELLSDTNPLMSQWGRAGREMTAQLENAQALTAELYHIPEAALQHPEYSTKVTNDVQSIVGSKTLTLLQAIQSDFLVLRNPHNSPPLALHAAEDSIQCHAAPSRLREVQIMYDQLLHLIDRHSNDAQPITAGDIRILVSDLSCYAPLLEATFGATESRLTLQMADVPLSDHSLFIQSFLALLHLAQSRWEAPALLDFLSSPFVQRRHQLSDTDLGRLREWIQQIPIYWGEDVMHRNSLLCDAHCPTNSVNNECATGTWQGGMHRLLLQLARPEIERLNIEFSDAPLISTCVTLLQSLADDLRPLRDGWQMTTEQWAKYLQCLCNAYLIPIDRSSASHRELLFNQFETLRCAGRSIPDAPWSFPSMLKRLELLLERHTMTLNEGDLDTIHACALRPHRSVPARIVVLLGMEEGTFPRKTGKSPLDLLTGTACADYCPSDAERDRYLFLECLLNARDYLLIGYNQTSHKDGKEQGPCLPVDELLAYIKTHFISESTPKVVTVNHPFYAFDARYFLKETSFYSHSTQAYRAAQAYLHRGMAPSLLSRQIPVQVARRRSQDELVINLRDLETAARDPAKLYLNQSLGIYLNTDQARQVKSLEPLVLSMSQRYALRDEALREPLKRAIERRAMRGQIPKGIFGGAALEQIQDELTPLLSLQTSAQGLQLLPRIQLTVNCREPQLIHPTLWQFPAIQVGKTKIIGSIDRLTMQGLLMDSEGSLPDAVKAWPTFLALHAIRPYLHHFCGTLPEHAILFLGSGRAKPSFFGDPTSHLEQLIEYYTRCLMTPSPFHATWVKQFLTGTELTLSTFLERELRESTSKYRHLHWLFGTATREQLSAIILPWIASANTLYRPLATNWFRLAEDADATV